MPLPRTRKYPAVSNLTVVLAAILVLLIVGAGQTASAQVPPPLNIFQNYFVTGDYVVSGWMEGAHDPTGYATGGISIPDTTQIAALNGVVQPGEQTTVPKGADIVAAYLYWGTVEGSQSSYAGQQALFNGYKIVGNIRGNPNAPTSWSSGGCTGASTGSKTMRFYRADVRPYLPLDLDPNSPTFGGIDVTNAGRPIPVWLADSGSNGNTAPFALGASLVIIYRVLSPATPLNAIVIYDGSYAPSNTASSTTQSILGFYEPGNAPGSGMPLAKLTHIVANGQTNKSEQVYFNNPQQPLPSLYGSNPPFPGVYHQNGSAWDNPTWIVNQYVKETDTSESTTVVPTASNSGCVSWGAMILSTTVKDSDGDGLLDVWEQQQGYQDAVSGQQISLPGANPNGKDLFVEIDYLANRDGLGNLLHSHLPKQQALNAVGQAFENKGINVHFDVGPNVYQGPGNNYIIQYSALPPGAYVGGNEISETAAALVCSSTTTCAFPNQTAISWKGGFEFVKNDGNLGNFQPGRSQSYHYALFGHSMGEPRSYWGTAANQFANNDPNDFAVQTMPQLVKIVNSGTKATVTIKSPSLLAPGISPAVGPLTLKPGDCGKGPQPPACSDANKGVITISGALIAPVVLGPLPQPPAPLNGTYVFRNASSTAQDANGIITTTFDITTAGVADNTYNFSNEPQLGVSYLGPTSSSGHGDFGGGGDLAVTFGLWGADNAAGCQVDPSLPLSLNQTYCDDQVGTLKAQTGTLMHELGHTLTLTHGGAYYSSNPLDPGASIPTYEVNCKPNFISVMNYLFQIRGFSDGGFDYSNQTLPQLNESTSAVGGVPALSEFTGVGTDLGQPAEHLTRWYSAPNAADLKLGHQALAHCDGSPLAQGEAPGVRVDGTLATPGTFSAPLDWNNNLTTPDNVAVVNATANGVDLNHNGFVGDSPFSGYSDWAHVDLQQINARASGFGFSEGGGLNRVGGGLNRVGGGVDGDGGGLNRVGGGLNRVGGGLNRVGGGIEQDTESANATVDAPKNLSCTQALSLNGSMIPGCTASSGTFLEKGKAVPLTWSPPDFGQIRSYTVWRAIGSFTNMQQVTASIAQFKPIATVTNPSSPNLPPSATLVDNMNLKSNTTYTYFVANSNSFGANSGASATLVVTVKF